MPLARFSPLGLGALKGATLISPARWRARAMSKLPCMRSKVSMETPKAFSTLIAISGERAARSFSSAESADRVTPSPLAASV